MKFFIIYNVHTGFVLRTGTCQDHLFNTQVQNENERILEGEADQKTQKVVKGQIVDKTAEELELGNSAPPPTFANRRAFITNEQWETILGRLTTLEAKVNE